MSYSGQFQIANLTGSIITSVSVYHNGFEYIEADSMEPGSFSQTAPFVSGSSDDWSISFRLNGGTTYYRTNKQCNYESEDAGQTVLIAFYAQNFSVLTPQSSACLNNYYDTN
jgi:hypothetical protein